MVPLTPLEVTARFALDGAPWQPHGAARCRQAFVHAFRLLPPGAYWLAVAVRYRDGSKRLVPHGERPVSAPLERDDMLRRHDGTRRLRHAPILHGLDRLVDADATQLEVRLRASRTHAKASELGSEWSEDDEASCEVRDGAARHAAEESGTGSDATSGDLSSAHASVAPPSSIGVEIDQTIGFRSAHAPSGTARGGKKKGTAPCAAAREAPRLSTRRRAP